VILRIHPPVDLPYWGNYRETSIEVDAMLKCVKCHDPLHKKPSGYFCPNCDTYISEQKGIFRFKSARIDNENHFPKEGFEKLYEMEANNFWFRVRNLIIGETVLRHFSAHSRLIEVGCGTGFVARYLKKIGYCVECGDLYIEGLQYCKERDAGEAYYQFNLYDPIFSEEYSAYCAFDVLEHLDDDRLALSNIYKGLKTGGFLFLTVPACGMLWSYVDEYAGHKRRYSSRDLEDKVRSAGFDIIRLSYFMTFLFPAIALSRLLSRLKSSNNQSTRIEKDSRVVRELELSPIINTLFYHIFRMELPLLRYMNLPFGSSLLCVAVKKKEIP
jgi:SAM-dependent methyltransferase